MLFPFIMFMLNLDPWMNIIPFIFVMIVLYYVRNLVVLIDGSEHNAPSYTAGIAAAKL